jgi:hypothetical protein
MMVAIRTIKLRIFLLDKSTGCLTASICKVRNWLVTLLNNVIRDLHFVF